MWYKKFLIFLKNPLWLLVFLNNRGFHILKDETYLKLRYKLSFDKKLDLKNPQTFNEKLQWLKLHDRKDIYTTMVDKYEVKKYVENVIGEEYVIPTIGIYDRFNDIDFDKLPKSFVIKCTHDSGGLVIVKDKSKFDIKKAKKKINKCLRKNFFYSGREWPYKNVKPRIIVEKYIEEEDIKELRDYKFFCFNGKAKFFKIDFNRFIKHQANYFDTDGKLLRFGEVTVPPDYNKKLNMPKNLNKMIDIAEKLSDNIPFVRIDFYEVSNRVYFGEITFYPSSGFGEFEPEEWDEKIGNYIKIIK